jgi:hypothetical protein
VYLVYLNSKKIVSVRASHPGGFDPGVRDVSPTGFKLGSLFLAILITLPIGNINCDHIKQLPQYSVYQ